MKYLQFSKLNQRLQISSDAKMYYWWFYNPELKGVYRQRAIEIAPFYERNGKNVFTFYQIKLQAFNKDSMYIVIGGNRTDKAEHIVNFKSLPFNCKHKNMKIWYKDNGMQPNDTVKSYITDFFNRISFPFSHHYELIISNELIIIKYLMPINTNTKRERAEDIIQNLYELADKLEQ